MDFQSFKNKILYKLFRLIPGANYRMLLKQYVKVSEIVPDAASEAWNLLHTNLRWQKKNRKSAKIVSLGYDCMIRTYTTIYMLKPGKRCGEKSLPFDLAITPPEMVLHFLQNDFQDYCSENWYYDLETTWWHNTPDTGVFYPHDTDCGPGDLEKIQFRLKQRIENFREILNFPGMLFFIVHKTSASRAEVFTAIKEQLEIKRKGKPFKILVIASDHDEECKAIEGMEYFYHPYPRADYIWHAKNMRYTPDGIAYEMSIAQRCQQFVNLQ